MIILQNKMLLQFLFFFFW